MDQLSPSHNKTILSCFSLKIPAFKFSTMTIWKPLFLFLVSFLFFQPWAKPQQSASGLGNESEPVSIIIERLEKDIPQLINYADIPGMSAALIRNGKLVWRRNFGVANAETGEAVTDATIFEAASLSKIVTAYAALQLVDQGKLELDRPLNKYLGNNYDCGNDDRINLITARHVLTHSAGFPIGDPKDRLRCPFISIRAKNSAIQVKGLSISPK